MYANNPALSMLVVATEDVSKFMTIAEATVAYGLLAPDNKLKMTYQDSTLLGALSRCITGKAAATPTDDLATQQQVENEEIVNGALSQKWKGLAIVHALLKRYIPRDKAAAIRLWYRLQTLRLTDDKLGQHIARFVSVYSEALALSPLAAIDESFRAFMLLESCKGELWAPHVQVVHATKIGDEATYGWDEIVSGLHQYHRNHISRQEEDKAAENKLAMSFRLQQQQEQHGEFQQQYRQANCPTAALQQHSDPWTWWRKGQG
jgi:hypothetical protein